MRRDQDNDLLLITIEEYDELPDGIVLHSVRGERAIKGYDDIDWGLRYGYLDWGLLTEWADSDTEHWQRQRKRLSIEPRPVNDVNDLRRKRVDPAKIDYTKKTKRPDKPSGAERVNS